jgi:hypothetical protein
MNAVPVRSLEVLTGAAWDAAIATTGASFRFSHRASAGHAFEAAFPEYAFEPYRAEYGDGTTLLVPLVRATRRLGALTTMLGMPLGLEGRPLVVDGELHAGHLRGLFSALPDCGRLTVHGGAGGGLPPDGIQSEASTHVLELTPGFSALWEKSFSSKNRNSTRKAEKAGIEVSREEDVGAYHALYAAAARGWGYSDPPYPRALLDALMDSGYAELWLGRLDGNPIAGALLLRGSDDVFYWSGAVAAEHRTLAPGNAVIKAAIQSACDRGLAYFDFGASTGLPGVSAFKESFGAAEVRYETIDLTSRRYRAAAAGQRMLLRVRPQA